ncbi:MAG: ABC transporter ATP-binding protein [bacterium]|nr:ABC transporter ATP-binding protein [bacterium]
MSLLRTLDLVVEDAGPRAGGVPLLAGVDLRVEPNTITSLIGESGCGKTTFARAITGLLPGTVTITGGSIFFAERLMQYDQLKSLRGSSIFYIPQDAAASLNPVLKIKRQVAEASLGNISYSRLPGILEDLNIHEPESVLESYPFQLSGGENQRCLLAMAILRKPRLLILDEPTSSLDHRSRASFMAEVERIRREHALTVLLITHNLLVTRSVSDYIYIMSKGKIVEHGPPLELLFEE